MDTPPEPQELLGDEAHRLRGVEGWAGLGELGRADLERVHALAQKHALEALSRGEDRATLRAQARGVTRLGEMLAGAGRRPGLPRLRNALFGRGDLVEVYMGDTPGHVGAPWVAGRVERVDKAFRAEWARDSSARGYYWRSTVRRVDGASWLPGLATLGLSTTEPRVLLAGERAELGRAADHAPAFHAAYCANAWRPWRPIWCIEAGLECDAEAMDMAAWLRA